MKKYRIPEADLKQVKLGPSYKRDIKIEGHSKRRKRQRFLKDIWIRTTIENGKVKRTDITGSQVIVLYPKGCQEIINSFVNEIKRLKLMSRDYSERINQLEKLVEDIRELKQLGGMTVVCMLDTGKIVTAYTFEDPWVVQKRVIYKKRKNVKE